MSEQTPLSGEASVAAKIAAIMVEMEYVPKRRKNEEQKYNYADAADVKALAGRAMGRHKLALITRPINVERAEAGKTQYGKPIYRTVVRMEMDVICAETGGKITIPWHGESNDSGDKGFNKALTSGIKYFLIDLFLIPTGDEPDPDADTEPEQTTWTKRNGSNGTRNGNGTRGAADKEWFDQTYADIAAAYAEFNDIEVPTEQAAYSKAIEVMVAWACDGNTTFTRANLQHTLDKITEFRQEQEDESLLLDEMEPVHADLEVGHNGIG